jgi:hypothetical protein
MMKGSQNLTRTKEEFEEEEEGWEVSSREDLEMEVEVGSVPKKLNSMFYDGNYWELRERKLKELGLRENFQKNVFPFGLKDEFPKENSKYELFEENGHEHRTNYENGKEKLYKGEHDLLNDILLKKVRILFILLIKINMIQQVL